MPQTISGAAGALCGAAPDTPYEHANVRALGAL